MLVVTLIRTKRLCGLVIFRHESAGPTWIFIHIQRGKYNFTVQFISRLGNFL